MDSGELNKDVGRWAKETRESLKKQFDVLNIEHVERSPSPVASRDVLAHFLARRQGLVSKVTFKFPRHMVFVHKGVGKGTPIGRAGSGARKEKPWFNNVMDRSIDDLADIVAGGAADIVVGRLRIE